MLRDLKALLIEARQKVPPMLTTLDSLSDDLIQLGGERENRVALQDLLLIKAVTANVHVNLW